MTISRFQGLFHLHGFRVDHREFSEPRIAAPIVAVSRDGDEETVLLGYPQRLLEAGCIFGGDMAEHLVGGRANEGRVRVPSGRWSCGGVSEWLVIGHQNNVIRRIVSDLIGAIAMRAALRESRANRVDNLQVA